MSELNLLILFIDKIGFNYKLDSMNSLTTLKVLGIEWHFSNGKLIGYNK